MSQAYTGSVLRLAPWIFVTFWSTGYIALKLGAPYAEPMTFLSIRFFGVLVILVPVLALLRVPLLRRREALQACFIGAWLHGVYLGAVAWAIDQGMAAAIAALIVSLQPVLTSVAAAALFKEEIRSVHWAGLILGLVGVALVVFPDLTLQGPAVRLDTVAACFVSLAAITFATLYQNMCARELDVRSGLIPQYVGALGIVGILALMLESQVVEWSSEFIFAVAWLIVVLSIGAVSLLLILLRENAVWRTSALFYLIPPVTAVFAWLLFGERLGWVQILGMGVVMMAVFLVRRRV